jgi:hypothetical protein
MASFKIIQLPNGTITSSITTNAYLQLSSFATKKYEYYIRLVDCCDI